LPDILFIPDFCAGMAVVPKTRMSMKVAGTGIILAMMGQDEYKSNKVI
jgi:hypothetical protein